MGTAQPIIEDLLEERTEAELRWLILEKHKLDQERRYNKLREYWPQGGFARFYNATNKYRELAVFGGSQLGKTTGLCALDVFHATGQYPDYYKGFRFDRPNDGIIVGETLLVNRNKLQLTLCGTDGRVGEFGTGLIPKDCLGYPTMSGVPGGYEMIPVKHVSGGWSRILMRANEQGRQALASLTGDWAHFDEEPDWDVFWEVRTRLQINRGLIICGFTPLLDMTEVVGRFFGPEADPSVYQMFFTIDDCELYTDERKAEIIAETPEHERGPRLYGKPGMGSGLVFPFAWEKISCDAFEIPKYYLRLAGIDFGWDHPTAAIWMAIDPDSGRRFFTHEYRESNLLPLVHAQALKEHGDWIPFAWPADGLQTNDQTGVQLQALYRSFGVNMLPLFAQHEDTGIAGGGAKLAKTNVDGGLIRMAQDFQKGTLKAFNHLGTLRGEMGIYHRKNGRVVKLKEDLISAGRYCDMMNRFAIVEPDRIIGGGRSVADADSWRL